MTVRVVRPVQEGEELTLFYIELYQRRELRQGVLRRLWQSDRRRYVCRCGKWKVRIHCQRAPRRQLWRGLQPGARKDGKDGGSSSPSSTAAREKLAADSAAARKMLNRMRSVIYDKASKRRVPGDSLLGWVVGLNAGDGAVIAHRRACLAAYLRMTPF